MGQGFARGKVVVAYAIKRARLRVMPKKLKRIPKLELLLNEFEEQIKAVNKEIKQAEKFRKSIRDRK